jgi:hypothetical protein
LLSPSAKRERDTHCHLSLDRDVRCLKAPHPGLARWLELWCAGAPEPQYLVSLRSGLWDLLANDYAAT